MYGTADDSGDDATSPKRRKANPEVAKRRPAAAAGTAMKVMQRPAAHSCGAPNNFPMGMKYMGTKKQSPQYDGTCTVYTDVGRATWRVKPCPGSRVTHKVPFTDNPQSQWKLVVEMVAALNKKK